VTLNHHHPEVLDTDFNFQLMKFKPIFLLLTRNFADASITTGAGTAQSV
jgi:hypothetical protein